MQSFPDHDENTHNQSMIADMLRNNCNPPSSLVGEGDLGLVQRADVAVDLLQLPEELRVVRGRPPVAVVHVLQLQVPLRHPLVQLVELTLQRLVRLLRRGLSKGGG